jgi:hypothetical protein
MATITHILALILGCFIGGLIVWLFNVPDTVINGRNKARKGGIINFTASQKDRKRFFKRKNK